MPCDFSWRKLVTYIQQHFKTCSQNFLNWMIPGTRTYERRNKGHRHRCMREFVEKAFPCNLTDPAHHLWGACAHTESTLLPTLPFRTIAFLIVGTVSSPRNFLPEQSLQLAWFTSCYTGRMEVQFQEKKPKNNLFTPVWTELEVAWTPPSACKGRYGHLYPRFLTLTRTHNSRAITSKEPVLSYPSLQRAEALELKSIFSIFISQGSTTGFLNMLRQFLKDSLLQKADMQ